MHAAQGYARVSGRVGVCLVTSGPGATNTVTGLADALMDSTPLVLVTGQVGSALLGTDAFQETNFVGITQAVTKWNCQVKRTEDIPAAIAKAFYIARSGRPGPVVVDITKDAQCGTAPFRYEKITSIRSYLPAPAPDAERIAEAARLIDQARRPLVMVGQGVILGNAEAELRALLDKSGMPAASTLLGLSALPTDHPQNVGMLGMHGNYGPNIKNQECDLLVAVGIVLTLLLCFRPTTAVKNAMKVFMALLNFWIAFVYYHIYCEPREYNDLLTLFWAIMGCMWIYDLAARNATLERTGHHTGFALLLFAMPFIYPLCSLALGREFPMITSPVMPCSVAVFTLALMLAFAERVNIILAMLLGHWALVGLSKVYYFGIPEDYLLACSVVPALYVFLREYIVAISQRPSKPSPRVLNGLLGVLCIIIGLFIAYTLLHQFNLFSEI